MAVEVIVFDIGETLVDETVVWERVADSARVPRFTLMALLGAAIARGETHLRAFDWLGVDAPVGDGFTAAELYPDALPCLHTLRARGFALGAVGNMRAVHEDVIRPHVDFVGSSERWGVEKPSAAFFQRVSAEAGTPPERIAYVGDRVDNDVVPALQAGMVAVHVRRGPWGYLHDPPADALRIRSLDELPTVLT
jgi:HAD superfamily hydrolase (TIGR01549 family)